jgi:drug/metabolite transporter (DMT)-like permease
VTLVRDPRRLVLLVAGIVLAGATAFGLWHLVVGGLINGNPRAAGFGAVLAVVAVVLLGGSIVLVRRLPRAGTDRS